MNNFSLLKKYRQCSSHLCLPSPFPIFPLALIVFSLVFIDLFSFHSYLNSVSIYDVPATCQSRDAKIKKDIALTFKKFVV